jgi:putative intracellular protease/amidase
MIDDVADDDVYDAIVLPGGTQGVNHFIANEQLEQIIKRHHATKSLIGAICAAPLVLHDFGLLPDNAVVTSHPGVAETFAPYTYTLERVAADGNIVTSRGAGTAFEFALALIRRLVDEKTSLRLASDIVMYE